MLSKVYVIPTKLNSTTSSFMTLQIKFSHACSLFGRLLYHICATLMSLSSMHHDDARQTTMRKIYALDSYAWVDSRRYTQSQGGTTTPSSESKSQEIRKNSNKHIYNRNFIRENSNCHPNIIYVLLSGLLLMLQWMSIGACIKCRYSRRRQFVQWTRTIFLWISPKSKWKNRVLWWKSRSISMRGKKVIISFSTRLFIK